MSTSPRVAVIDDHPDSREDYSSHLKLAGYEPVPFATVPSSFEALMTEVRRQHIQYAVCDHRLSEQNYARFLGARAVRMFYENRIPALLVTEWKSDDIETTIRPNLRWIPRLIQSTQARRGVFGDALEAARKEVIEKEVPIERRGYRAILRSVERVMHGNIPVLRVSIAQWKLGEPVGLPEKMLPENIRLTLDTTRFLYATVNISANSSDEIYFENFEVPHPDDVEAALSKTNHS